MSEMPQSLLDRFLGSDARCTPDPARSGATNLMLTPSFAGTKNQMKSTSIFDRSFGERSMRQAGIVENANEVCAVGPPPFGPQ